MQKPFLTYLWVALAGSVLMLGSETRATTYDAAADWAIGAMPTPWSYGYLDPSNNNTGANLTLFNGSHTNWDGSHPGVQFWDLNNTTFGSVAKNTTASQQTVWTTIQMNAGQLVAHPGNAANLAADVRFTAPAAMSVNISALFAAADTGGTSTDVHVYLNGASVFDSAVNAQVGAPGVNYANGTPIALSAGGIIDFSVGFKGTVADNSYTNDGTSLAASITTVPEPGALGLFGLGAVGLLAAARRRRSA